MGAAIGVFDGRGGAARAAAALRAGQDDQRPARAALRRLRARPTTRASCSRAERGDRGAPLVDLDSRYYKLVRDFDARFPAGAPSLVGCERLEVAGDVAFGRDVVVRGRVRVEHDDGEQHRIADGVGARGLMRAVLVAGGAGAGLSPLTGEIPAAMVPVLDRPLLGHTVDLLWRQGIDEIAVTLGRHGEIVARHFGPRSTTGATTGRWAPRGRSRRAATWSATSRSWRSPASRSPIST